MNKNQFVHLLRAIVWDPKADSRHYTYTLSEDVTLAIPLQIAPPAPFENEWMKIGKYAGEWHCLLKKGYAWDGCTGAADFARWRTNLQDAMALIEAGKVDDGVALAAPLIGSAGHDPTYQFIGAIAEAWGVPISAVREWGDKFFAALMLMARGGAGQTSRYFWAVRAVGGVWHWLRKPRSRIELNPARWFAVALVAGAVALGGGCSTAGRLGAGVGAAAGVVAWHNYCVAEAERSEREQIEAGLTPLVKTNAALIRDNAWGYVAFGLVGGLAGNQIAEYAADRAEKTTVYSPEVTNNNYYPGPEPVDAGGDAGGGE